MFKANHTIAHGFAKKLYCLRKGIVTELLICLFKNSAKSLAQGEEAAIAVFSKQNQWIG
jgi:hypothetical protein